VWEGWDRPTPRKLRVAVEYKVEFNAGVELKVFASLTRLCSCPPMTAAGMPLPVSATLCAISLLVAHYASASHHTWWLRVLQAMRVTCYRTRCPYISPMHRWSVLLHIILILTQGCGYAHLSYPYVSTLLTQGVHYARSIYWTNTFQERQWS